MSNFNTNLGPDTPRFESKEREPNGHTLYDYQSVVDALHECGLPNDDLVAIADTVENWSMSLPPWENVEDIRRLARAMEDPTDDAQAAAKELFQKAEQILTNDYWDKAHYSIDHANEIVATRPSQLFVKTDEGSVLPIDAILSSGQLGDEMERYIRSSDIIVDSDRMTLLIDSSKMPHHERAVVNNYMRKLEIPSAII